MPITRVKYYDVFAFTASDGFSPAKPPHCAVGGTLEKNRKAIDSRVAVLLDPNESRLELDTATLQVAKDNDVTIGITFRQFLAAGRFKRIKLLSSYRKLVQLCLRMGNRLVISSGAKDESELCTPEQLVAFGVFLGLTRQQAKWSISKVPEYLMGVRE